MNACELVSEMIDRNLKELEEVKEFTEKSENQYAYGVKVQLIANLEQMKKWDFAKEKGLDFDVNGKYPL